MIDVTGKSEARKSLVDNFKEHMRKLFHYLGNIAVVAIVLIAVFIIGGVAPKYFGVTDWYSFRVVVSGSMSPTIPVGSVVATYPTGSYQVGDVVTFFKKESGSNEPTTHRIVRIEKGSQDLGGENAYITKGDANNTVDPLKKEKSDILGEVFLHVPYAGYLAVFVQEHRWPVALFLFAILILWIGIDRLRK